AGQDVAGDLDRVERAGPDVRVAVHVDVALRAGVARGHVEQVDTGVGGDVARPALCHLGIVRFVEQRWYPQLEVETRRDEHVGLAQQRHEARLRLDVMRVLVAGGNRAYDAPIPDDFARDGPVR